MIKREFRALIYTSALFVKSVSIKIQFFLKKGIANFKSIVYTSRCCDMIAMKREVAARLWQVFRGANVKLGNWRQVTVRNYYNGH